METFALWLVLPFLIVGIIAAVLLAQLSKKERIKGAFHIGNGILYTHELIPSEFPISEIENIEIDYFIRNGRKYLIRFHLRNGSHAGLLITYDIENELARLKKELQENGFKKYPL